MIHRFGISIIFSVLLLSFYPIPSLSATVPVTDCWKALSFDLCTIQDPTGICASKFFQNQIADATYRRQLFDYLIERYRSVTIGKSIDAILSTAFDPTNTTYAAYLDTTYGTECATDSGVQSLLIGSNVEQLAILFREDWLIVMRQAMHCSENEIWVLNLDCVCKEDKDCDVLTGAQHSSAFKAVAFMIGIFGVFVLFGFVALTRQQWTVALGHKRLENSIEYLAERDRDAPSRKQTDSATSTKSLQRTRNVIHSPSSALSPSPSISSFISSSITPPPIRSSATARKITQDDPFSVAAAATASRVATQSFAAAVSSQPPPHQSTLQKSPFET